MKKIPFLVLMIIAVSCGTTKTIETDRPLYEVLLEKNNGGAQIKFFEIISLPEEFVMIKSDPELKDKVSPNDIQTANFLILSAGEKNSGGYSIGIDKVEETDKNIIVTIKETSPKPGEMATMSITTPYTVVRINSKKEIVIK